MPDGKQTVVVTGVAGNLGLRLLPHLAGYNVIGLDIKPPVADAPLSFEKVDLGREASCGQLVELLRRSKAVAVVHLAFVIDPVRTGVLQNDHMWQINVAGTARVMEAITEVNRNYGGRVQKFIFPSSVSAYGSDLAFPATESTPLGGHTLPYAVHKREADEVVQYRASKLGSCSTYILRPHIYAGATMQNYLIGALRGTPTGRGKIAQRWREKGVRLPLVVPLGERYERNLFQFVHVDDVARLIAYILYQPETTARTMILNVAGRGQPITFGRCAEIAHQKVIRVPSAAACRMILSALWKLGISGMPPEALPYVIGSYTMDTSRLRAFLGSEYEHVIRYTSEDALRDCFTPSHPDEHLPDSQDNEPAPQNTTVFGPTQ